MSHTQLPPAQRAAHVIDTWDLGPTIQILLLQKQDLTRTQAEAMAAEYRRYLRLRAMFPHLRLPISSKLDPIWHAHLLHTQDYAAMWHQAGMVFVHHHPRLTEQEKAEQEALYRETMLPLYRSQFGNPPPEFWPATDGEAICD